MKKVFKWLGFAVLIPLLLILILAATLYLPPVQRWMVAKATQIASEQTGMDISIGSVSLEWPLNLGINDLRILHPNDSLPDVTDTIADVRKMVVDVRLWPLLRQKVFIDGLSVQGVHLNTNGFISDIRVSGDIGELWLISRGIDLKHESIRVNGARLSEADLNINLTDTATVDTTTSALSWMIDIDKLTIEGTSVCVNLPGDTLIIGTYIGSAEAHEANIDLSRSVYQITHLDWLDGKLSYNIKNTPETSGFDYNHIDLSDISLGLDSIYYGWPLRMNIRQLSMKEKSGLEVTSLTAHLQMDSTHIALPDLSIRTTDSDLMAELDMDMAALSDSLSDGRLSLRLNAQLGKQDLTRFMGSLPQPFVEQLPNHPIFLKGSADGNMHQLTLTGVTMEWPTALHATISGKAENISDADHLKADLVLNAKGDDLNFITALLDRKTADKIRIPRGITFDGHLLADGPRYSGHLQVQENECTADADFAIDSRKSYDQYDVDISLLKFNPYHFAPIDSLLNVNLDASATLRNGRGVASVTGHNNLFDGTIGIDALLSTKRIEATLTADLSKADLYHMQITDKPLSIGLCGHIDISSDLKLTHRASGLLADITIRDGKATYRPKDVGLLLQTTPDTTYLRAQSGDMIAKLDASGNYEQLAQKLQTLQDSIISQMDQRVIDQPAIKPLLPSMKLHLESKGDNPLASLLNTDNISYKDMLLNLDCSPESGINGESHLYSLVYDSIRIDTIRLNLTQKGERLTYQGQVRNNRKNPQFVFNALLDGHLHEHGALMGLRYFDREERIGIRIGATAEMERGGIRFKLMPERPTLGYKEFNLNDDNYIFLSANKKIQAKVDLIADDKTGMKLYTEHQDSTMQQDLTISLNRIDMGELTSALPYVPHITGRLNGDYHILQDQQDHFSIASDMAIANMTYEGSPIGNLSTEFVYLLKDGDGEQQSGETHAIDGRLMLDEDEIGLLKGSYHNDEEGRIDAVFTMTHMPLSLVNGFVPDQLIGLDGYGEGSLSIRGTTAKPVVNGEVYVEDAHLISIPYGIRMRFDDDPIRIVNSTLKLENFGLYAYNDEPLNMMGDIDFADTEHIKVDLRMRARNLQLINAKQDLKSIAFGKAFVNFAARMNGTLDDLKMRGRLDVLGSTDLTYMLLDSPLSTDNRLDELVKFTDFSDSTQTVVNRPAPSGLDVDLTVNVSQGAHIICDLNVEQTNYVDLTGGGDLRLRYGNELSLTGRYTLSSGEMKYSLPVIPLKTFTIKDGSYVEFTGDPMNPRLNITATERTKAAVSNDGGQGRSVTFDCGVVITKTLNDMGLSFVIDAPEDQTISGELATMSTEERGKIAVTMLTTGMYLADGNTSRFSMNSALSSFLQSEINNITGSALKTLDLSVGIDNSTDASGASHTDYSFKFAKRFFDNRLKVEVGGKVSSGSSDAMGQKQSFFDNVTMEYRLNQDATKNVKLFYFQNVYDWLEGYTSKYGGGFIWRRQLDNFWDILRFWRKEQQPLMPMRPQQRQILPTDTLKTQQP